MKLENTKHSYKALDAMRGVAAISVVFLHAGSMLGVTAFPHAYLAVDFFFVLSGFVIAYAYDERIGLGLLRPMDFVVTRVIRFYPLYFAALILGLSYEISLSVAHHPIALSANTLMLASLSALLFVPWPIATRNSALFPLNFPAWSLFYELTINILYAFVQRYLSTRTLLAVLCLSGAALIFVVIDAGSADIGPTITGVFSGTVRTIFSFTFGLLIFRFNIRPKPLPVLLLLSVLGLAMAVPRLTREWGATYDIVFIFCISPALIVAGSVCKPSRRWIPTIEYVGLISFPIYAIHRPVLTIAGNLAKVLHLSEATGAAGAIIAMLAICPALVRLYDTPLRKFANSRRRTNHASNLTIKENKSSNNQ